MTGGSASFGISSKNAIELAFKNINDKVALMAKTGACWRITSRSSRNTNAMEAGLSGQGCCRYRPKPFLGYDSRRRDQ
ncbi:MAG: hypothetical protein ACLR2G_04000 [Phascolarctobacterium faecium]